MADHRALREFLSDPATYPEGGPVVVCETHISLVFLTNGFAYKLCKPVDFGFLDFSTREARFVDCHNEVRLNRRLAPGVYLGVVPVTERDGVLQLDGDGEPVDWLVRMRRLPDEATLASRIAVGTASEEDVDRLLDVLVPFFAEAERNAEIDAAGRPERIRRHLVENLDVLTDDDESVSAGDVARLRSATFGFLVTRRALFEGRIDEGRIRGGHGDLRAEHVYLLDPPVVVDGIEFCEEYRHLDTADEIGFLAMDLERLGRPDLATHLRNAYRTRAGDDVPEALFAFYEAYRYSVRAKVACLRAAERTGVERSASFEEARGEVRSAIDRLQPHASPLCLVVCGTSGSGKSTVAAALAELIGAEHLRSDVVRKQLFGVDETNHDADPALLYSKEASQRTYAELATRAVTVVDDGISIVLDATYQRAADRDALCVAIAPTGASPLFVECVCPPEVAESRIRTRAVIGTDASDADVSVLEGQRASFEPFSASESPRVCRVDTSGPVTGIVDRIVSRLADV